MEMKNILAIRPELIAADQELALQNHTADKLRIIANLIEYGDYDAVENELDKGPVGVMPGFNNSFISFDEIPLSNGQNNKTDIGDIIARLQDLQRMQKAMVQK